MQIFIQNNISFISRIKNIYKSITNIGIRPSIDDGDAATIETFIYDFDEDIYGSKVSVVLDRYIRPEMKFSGLEELTSQISRDIKVASEM